MQFFILSFLEYFGVFVKYFLICQIFTYTCIYFIQNPELYGSFIVDFDMSPCLDGSFEGACQDDQIGPFLFVFYEFIKHYRQCLGILFSFF